MKEWCFCSWRKTLWSVRKREEMENPSEGSEREKNRGLPKGRTSAGIVTLKGSFLIL